MQILAIDTATKSCSVAVASDISLLAETTVVSSQTHSKHLMTSIDQVLQMAQLQIDELDGFSVTRGPGSFTGLRIGISVIKGLVTASGKPLVGVSTLDVLARQAGTALALICSVIDARKNEVYVSRYRLRDDVLYNEFAARALPIRKAIQDIIEPCMFIGDGALLYRDTILDKLGRAAYFAPAYQHTIRASTVASLSMERFLKGESDAVGTFVPFYIRRSDAELNVDTSVRHRRT